MSPAAWIPGLIPFYSVRYSGNPTISRKQAPLRASLAGRRMAYALLNQQGMTILSGRGPVFALLSIMVLGACNKSNPAAPSPPAASAGSTSFVFLTGSAPMTGGTSQFTATAVGADGAQTNVTSQATWRSSNQSIVAVAPGGVVRGVTVGAADVSATYDGVTGSTPLIVSAMPCGFSVDPTTAAIPGAGGSLTVSVTNVQGQQCSWSAAASGFLRIEGPASGTGSGAITVMADPNTGATRVGTIAVAGASVTVSQARTACVASVSPQTQNVGDVGGTFLVNVTAPGGCEWTVTPSAPFITVSGASTRSGTEQLAYQVAPNPGATSRTATIRIDRFELTVTQAGTIAGGGDR
jgi:hypothetical protein